MVSGIDENGIKGTVAFYDVVNTIIYEDYYGDMKGRAIELPAVQIDCGELGDSEIIIDNKEYTYLPNNIPNVK